MPPPDWPSLISAAMSVRPAGVTAHTYRGKKWATYSTPVVLGCDDGIDYVVKGSQTGKAIVSEQVVGSLGKLIGAPIPAIKTVLVSSDLISLNAPDLGHLYAGLAHGSPLQENCTDKQWLGHLDVVENQKRFAALAVLFGWAQAGDQQLIYCLDKPQLVWSVDHGHFFPGGPAWSTASLRVSGTATVLDAIASVCKPEHIREVIEMLASISFEQIAAIVASPPPTWAVTMDERVELATFIERRRTDLLGRKP